MGRVLVATAFIALASQAIAQNAAPQTPAQQQQQQPPVVFTDLIKTYAQYPEFFAMLDKNDQKFLDDFKKLDLATIKSLPVTVQKALYDRFNVKFITFKETKDKLGHQVKSLKDRKIATPLSDKDVIVDLDLKIKASEDQFRQVRIVLFSMSVEANKAVLDTMKNRGLKTATQSKADAAASSAATAKNTPPKMPGTYQGSKIDRMNTSDSDKLNLTPVDPEFYSTQLGQKLEKDLGGRADFWNYDFDQDELYVVVGDNIGKLQVKQKDDATRIIQTRVGGDFQDFPSNYQGDEQVNLNAANGRFLTGDKADPTLFGPFANPQPDRSIAEDKIPHVTQEAPVSNPAAGPSNGALPPIHSHEH